MRKAIFFDRDGVVNHRIVGDYVKFPEEFVFSDGFFEFFSLVKSKGFLAILVTNQQGIGKGLMTAEQLQAVHNFMINELLEKTGFAFDAIYFCPDLAGVDSNRRKPKPGMFEEAIAEFGINAEQSWTIGDSRSDVQAGKAVGTGTILLGMHQRDEFTDFVFPSINDIGKFFDENVN